MECRNVFSIFFALLVSACVCSCTAYDEDNGDNLNNNKGEQGDIIVSQGADSNKKGLGGNVCKTGEECLSQVCANARCGCDDTVECIKGNYCTNENICESKKATGDSCSNNVECLSNNCEGGVCEVTKKAVGESCELGSECLSGLCDGRCMGDCSKAADCASNMICDSGKCHSIIDCPDNDGECFTTLSLTPNAGWLGSLLDASSINSGDYLSSHYSIELPTFSDHDLSLCVRPMLSVLNIQILKATLSDFYQLLYLGSNANYIMSVALDHFGETNEKGEFVTETYTDIDNNRIQYKGGAIFKAILAGRSSNVNIVQGLLNAFSQDAQAAAKARILLQVGEFLSEPRVAGRMKNIGCFNMPVQRSKGENIIPMTFRSIHGMEARKAYMKAYLSNSELMSNDTHYTFSLGSSIQNDDGKAFKDKLEFPLNYKVMAYDTDTVASAAVANSSIGDKQFYFKVNYKPGVDMFLCNEYDISMGYCPGRVQVDYKQRCVGLSPEEYQDKCRRIEYNGNEYYVPEEPQLIIKNSTDGLSCSASDLSKESFKQDYPNCTPKVSVDLEKIQLLIQIDRSMDQASIKK